MEIYRRQSIGLLSSPSNSNSIAINDSIYWAVIRWYLNAKMKINRKLMIESWIHAFPPPCFRPPDDLIKLSIRGNDDALIITTAWY